jgi:hypothetical protein
MPILLHNKTQQQRHSFPISVRLPEARESSTDIKESSDTRIATSNDDTLSAGIPKHRRGFSNLSDLFSGPPSLHAPINSDAEVRAILHGSDLRLLPLPSHHLLQLHGERLQYGQRWCLCFLPGRQQSTSTIRVSPGASRFKPPSNDTFLGISSSLRSVKPTTFSSMDGSESQQDRIT